MPRPPRADEAGELYHVLNHGESHDDIFHEESDFDAFELVLHEALQLFHVELFSYQLMPNHFHLVLRTQVDGEMGRFVGWVCGTHTLRYRADYGTTGPGRIYQRRYKSFPIQNNDHFLNVCHYVEQNALRAGLVDRTEDWRWGSLARWLQKPEPNPKLLSRWPVNRTPKWAARVNEPLTEEALADIRVCATRGRPFGEKRWRDTTAKRLNLVSTIRPRGRQRIHPLKSQAK